MNATKRTHAERQAMIHAYASEQADHAARNSGELCDSARIAIGAAAHAYRKASESADRGILWCDMRGIEWATVADAIAMCTTAGLRRMTA